MGVTRASDKTSDWKKRSQKRPPYRMGLAHTYAVASYFIYISLSGGCMALRRLHEDERSAQHHALTPELSTSRGGQHCYNPRLGIDGSRSI